MKGIVFTEFLEMVESEFGLETVDNIIEKADLPSQGIYTSVATYEFNEMVALVTQLSEEVDLPAGDLIYAFGLYLFSSLKKCSSRGNTKLFVSHWSFVLYRRPYTCTR